MPVSEAGFVSLGDGGKSRGGGLLSRPPELEEGDHGTQEEDPSPPNNLATGPLGPEGS